MLIQPSILVFRVVFLKQCQKTACTFCTSRFLLIKMLWESEIIDYRKQKLIAFFLPQSQNTKNIIAFFTVEIF